MTFNPTFIKLNRVPLLLVLISLVFYLSFAYDLLRTDYLKLISLYAALFYFFYKLVQIAKHNLKFLTLIAFLFRAVFILAIPNLSQDFYRFIWDGRMILEGFNPYLFSVESFVSSGNYPVEQTKELYEGMGQLNASHYSNYPPLNQLCFVIAGLFAGKSIIGSVVVMRLLIIAADFGVLFFGKRLLKRLHLPEHMIFWYLLNPFIIIELTGNLHFEGVMIFFLVWSLYLLHKGKWQYSAVVMALSISIKLIPLIFLPLLFNWFKSSDVSGNEEGLGQSKLIGTTTKKGIIKLCYYYLVIAVITLLLFLPFYSSEFILNYTETVGLWFKSFEFNASIYYIAREIGFWIYGYNQIAFLGKFFAICTFLFVVYLSLFKKLRTTSDLMTLMLFALSFYYFTSTTVHPWYIATLVMLSVFTNFRFPLVWSFTIILSYLSYLNLNSADKSENLWIIALEYAIVYGVLIYELGFNKRPVQLAST